MKRYTQLILNILVPILMMAAVVIFVPKLIIFFIPFIIGAVIAWIANPLIRFLNTKTKLMERQHASVVIIIFMLVLIGAILYLVLSAAVRFCVGFAKICRIWCGTSHSFSGVSAFPSEPAAAPVAESAGDGSGWRFGYTGSQ